MAGGEFGAVDLVVAAVLLLSGLLAFARGFVRELLAIVTWVGAAVAALYLFGSVKPYAIQVISPSWLAGAVAGVGLFLAVFIALTLLARPMVGRVKDSPLKGLDRVLGLVFGLLRGAILLSLAFLMATWLFPAKEMPVWLATAKSRPYLERGAAIIRSVSPAQIVPEAASEGTKDAAPEADKGYKPEQRQDLDRLIRQTE